jgi:hypothetical protein
MRRIRTLAVLALLNASAGMAFAQAASITIDTTASYEQALTCYRFHDVTMQIANAMKGRANIAENQKAQYEAVSKKSSYLQQKWLAQIGVAGGKKTVDQLNADLVRVTASVVTDANAGLSGDAEAQARNNAIRDKCLTFEKVETSATPGAVTTLPLVPTAPAAPN